MSAQRPKRRLASHRRPANQSQSSPRTDEVHAPGNSNVAQQHIPEDDIHSNSDNVPSPELKANRRKLGSRRRNKGQHEKDSATELCDKPEEEVGNFQVKEAVKSERKEELCDAANDDSLYAAVMSAMNSPEDVSENPRGEDHEDESDLNLMSSSDIVEPVRERSNDRARLTGSSETPRSSQLEEKKTSEDADLLQQEGNPKSAESREEITTDEGNKTHHNHDPATVSSSRDEFSADEKQNEQRDDANVGATVNRRKLGSSRKNKRPRRVEDRVAQAYHETKEEVRNLSGCGDLERSNVSSEETELQERPVEPDAETTRTVDLCDRDHPPLQAPVTVSVTESDENSVLFREDSEADSLMTASTVTPTLMSTEQSNSREEGASTPTNEEDEQFIVSEVGRRHETETQGIHECDDAVMHDGTEHSEICSINLTHLTEACDSSQSSDDVTKCLNVDEFLTQDDDVEALDQIRGDPHPENSQTSDIEGEDPAFEGWLVDDTENREEPGSVHENEGEQNFSSSGAEMSVMMETAVQEVSEEITLEGNDRFDRVKSDDGESSVTTEERNHEEPAEPECRVSCPEDEMSTEDEHNEQLSGALDSKDVEVHQEEVQQTQKSRESSQSLQTETESDSQANDKEETLTGNRRKLGSSRRRKERRHVPDSESKAVTRVHVSEEEKTETMTRDMIVLDPDSTERIRETGSETKDEADQTPQEDATSQSHNSVDNGTAVPTGGADVNVNQVEKKLVTEPDDFFPPTGYDSIKADVRESAEGLKRRDDVDDVLIRDDNSGPGQVDARHTGVSVDRQSEPTTPGNGLGARRKTGLNRELQYHKDEETSGERRHDGTEGEAEPLMSSKVNAQSSVNNVCEEQQQQRCVADLTLDSLRPQVLPVGSVQGEDDEDEESTVALTNVDTTKCVVSREAGERVENVRVEEPAEGTRNTNFETMNANFSPANRRRKMGSTRRSLGSGSRGKDQEVTMVGGVVAEEPELHDDEEKLGSHMKSPGPLSRSTDMDHGLSPEPQTSPKPDVTAGRRRKMGSHRTSHVRQSPTQKVVVEDKVMDARREEDRRLTAERHQLRDESLGLDRSAELGCLWEDQSEEKPSSISVSGETERSHILSEKAPTTGTTVTTVAPGPEAGIHTKFSSGSASIDADVESRIFNVLLVGNSNVGKTSFLKRAQSGKFSFDMPPSIGLDSCRWTVVVDGKPVVLLLWDTAGQERFRSITRQMFHRAQAFLLMYDVTSSQSFSAVSYWANCIQEDAAEHVTVVLVGNKSDREERRVQAEDGETLSKEYNFDFLECSAATGENVIHTLETLARMLKQKADTRDESMVLHKDPPHRKRAGCC